MDPVAALRGGRFAVALRLAAANIVVEAHGPGRRDEAATD